MRFNDYFGLSILVETHIQKKLESNIRPNLVHDVMKILNDNPNSPLVQYIIKRTKNPNSVVPQNFKISQVGTLDSYKLDPDVFNKLIDVTAGDVGPGEILIALTAGKWIGGTGGDTDVLLDGIGNVEIKYLGPFAHSTNVPFGSGKQRLIDGTDFDVVTRSVAKIAKNNPSILKNNLEPAEVKHFIDDVIDQIFIFDENLSTNSLRIIGRLLRNAEKNGDTVFSSKGLTFDRLKKSMETAIKEAVGDAEYLMFLGEQNDPTKEGAVLEGRYYIMPKDDVKYYMFYRIYKNSRIKIAPFSTEKEFHDKTITEEVLSEMPKVHNYEDYDEEGYNPKDWDPSDIFNDYEDSAKVLWKNGDSEIREVVDMEYGPKDKIINYGLFVNDRLVSASQVDVIDGEKFSVDGLMPILSRSATLESERGRGYSKLLTKFIFKKYKKLASDLELFTNKGNSFGGSVSKWVKMLPSLGNAFNFDENNRDYTEFDVDEGIHGMDSVDTRFVVFDRSYPIKELPRGDK